ncbi:unnamed protein product [Ceutorhynchus assimilis]|uniref:DNA 3'-5' helicase n=1 Tax=Ceutorhynchus assimilis TaxID=467358 RepID=A0A9N9QI85_9CUCU|nr:unnamed protein product [Ceutorhynchus assimilis]
MPEFRSIEEIPAKYRSVFQEYPCFNVVQSEVLNDALNTDNSLVVSAPTGSGKTAIFEMAIIRHLTLNETDHNTINNKIVYISPMKALCQERLVDWHKKFADFNVRCISLTSDSPDDIDIRTIAQYNLLISTPEKWDVITRRWRENIQLMTTITLFLIDEVHLLNADTRGSTLEVIVSRMKTAITALTAYTTKWNIRFVALSATIPNVEDVAEWLGPTSVKYKFTEEVRPVKLDKIVLGFAFHPQNQSVFKFDMTLNYKLPSLISKYSEGKPTLIFCNTRKSVEMTARHLVQNLQVTLNQEQKQDLMSISRQLSDVNLRQQIVHGIAFHHAGLVHENRYLIEESFRKAQIPVLVTTSTLAMGVNLPAHLVIIKSTKCYCDNGYKDYDEMSIFQMIGRAGRSQFDVSATALILTSLQDKVKYEKMLSCSQTIESNLHKHLTEHLNAEVVLKTITDLCVAMRWLSSTFLYVRAIRSPEKYKFPSGLTKEKIDKKLLDMCQLDLNKLVGAGMIQISEDIEITPTIVGGIMAKYYVAFETMKLFTQISGNEILIQILGIISKCKEFSEIYLRNNDKRCLNTLNRCSKTECIRYPLKGRIKTSDMKVNVIIQAILGNLDIHDQSILCDSVRIMRSCERLANCLIEYLETRDKCYSALLNTTILAKCFRVKLWENSPYVSKQLTGVGQVMSRSLMKAGKTTLKKLADTNPRHIEMIISRRAPFGNTLVDEAVHLPDYTMTLEKCGKDAELCIILHNPSQIEEKCTISLNSKMTLLVGDSNHNILVYEKYEHSYMVENPQVRQKISMDIKNVEYVKANFISENYVGIDCFAYCYFEPIVDDQNQTIAKTPKKIQQTFMNSYMKCVKRPQPFIEVASNKNKSEIVNTDSNIKSIEENKHINLPEKKKTFHFRNNKEVAGSRISPVNKETQIVDPAKPVNYSFATKDSKCDENSLKTPKKKYYVSKNLSNKTGSINKHDSLLSESFTNAIIAELESDKLAIEAGDEANFNEDSDITETRAHEYNKNEVVPVEKDVPMQTTEDVNYRPNDGQLATKLGQNKVTEIQKQENLSKMNVPDSTYERNKPQSITIFSPHPKRVKKHEEYTPSFAETPQKNIKWRSPLVTSPAVKYSPTNLYDFPIPRAGKEVDHNDFRDGAHNTSMSSLASSFASERINSSTSVKSVKRKSKFQFPLSDHDCLEETNYNPSTKRGNAFDEFVDLEQYGIANRQKESITQSSHAGKYYSQLMNSEPEKSGAKEEPSTKIISSTSQSKPTSNTQDFQQSQDLYSDNDFLSQETHQVAKSRADFVPDTHEPKSITNVSPFTQPTPIAYQHHPEINLNNVSRDNFEYYPQRNPEIDLLNRSFIEPPNNYQHSDFEDYHRQTPLFDSQRPSFDSQRPLFDFQRPSFESQRPTFDSQRPLFDSQRPLFDSPQRYAPRVCSYFSQQQPCFSVPSTFPHHVCCNHYPRMNHYCKPYPDSIPELIPYRSYVENRNLHHTRPYTISINDIPDSCIDHFSQQLDEPSFVVNNNPANNFVENVPRYDASGFNCESTSLAYQNKENIFKPQSQSYAPSYRRAQSTPENQLPTQISKENVSKLFATSSRRKLSHHDSREATRPQSLHLLAQSAQRRSVNFNSVEERHNNSMIEPHGETYRFSSSRNPNSVQYGSMLSNDNREYLPDRFRGFRK